MNLRERLGSSTGKVSRTWCSALIIIALFGAGLGCTFLCHSPERPVFPKRCAPQGGAAHTAIIIPGLNTASDAFNELSQLFCANKIAPHIVELRDNAANDQLEWWREDLRKEVDRARALNPNAPLALVGYSLGAALSIDYVVQEPDNVDTLVLLAPSIAIRALPHFFLELGVMIPGNLDIPSLAPIGYRARRYTSLDNYRALLDLQEKIGEDKVVLPANSLVVVRKDDSLVSAIETQRWVDGLAPKPEMMILEPSNNRLVHSHLILDRYSVGDRDWPLFSERVLNTILRR